MEFTIAVQGDSRLAVLTWQAPSPTVDLSRAAFEALAAHPEFAANHAVISDWRAAVTAPEAAFVRDFLTLLGAYRTTGVILGPWATVVPKAAAAIYGMARMTEILGEDRGLRYRGFTDFDDAVEWAKAHTGP